MKLPLLNRRFQFSLRTLLIFTVLIGLAFSLYVNWNAIQRRWWIHQLKSYVNQDLRKLDEDQQQKIAELRRNLAPENPGNMEYGFFKSWYVWQKRPDDELILFESDAAFTIPGAGTWRLTVFESKGNIITKIIKSTGNRNWPDDASFAFNSDNTGTLTILTSQLNGKPIGKRIYTYKNHDLKLIKLFAVNGDEIPLDSEYGKGEE
jgi:hypothetical protein